MDKNIKPVIRMRGDKQVKIEHDGYSLYLSVMRNGFQWTSTGIDDEILSMIREVIDEYIERKGNTMDSDLNSKARSFLANEIYKAGGLLEQWQQHPNVDLMAQREIIGLIKCALDQLAHNLEEET